MAVDLGGWDDHDPGTVFGMNPRGLQPSAEQDVVGGEGMDNAKGEGFLKGPSVRGKGGAVLHALFPELPGEGDGVAMQVENQRRHAGRRDTAHSAVGGHEQTRGSLGGVQLAVDDFVANGGPADLALEPHIHAVRGEEPQMLREEQGRGIGQGHEAEAEHCAFWMEYVGHG